MDTIPQDTPQGNLKPETTFIYCLRDPRTQEIRYIGKANNLERRLIEHLRPAKRDVCYRTHWINELKQCGLKPIIEVIEEVPYAIWPERECYWIEFYQQQGAPLTNTTPGGKGGNPSPEGIARLIASKTGKKKRPWTEEERRTISKNLTDRPVSEATRDKIAFAQRGKKRKPLSEKHKAKIANAEKGKKQKPESVIKSADARRGKKRTPAQRANMIEGRKRARAMRINPPSLWSDAS